MGFATTPVQSSRVIARDMSRSIQCLGVNTDHYVQHLRDMWDDDYPYRTCDPFTEEDMYSHAHDEYYETDLSTIQVANKDHTIDKFLFVAHYLDWCLTLMQHGDNQIDWEFSVWDGKVSVFHPEEAKNHIMDYHDQDVYDRWRRHVRKSFDVAAPRLLAECKKRIPKLRAWSVTTCDASERLIRSLDGVIVINKIAYLIW